MVSLSSVAKLAAIAGVVLTFVSLGGAGGIGRRIGAGFNAFGQGVIGGVSGLLPQTGGVTNTQTGGATIDSIVNDAGLRDQVTGETGDATLGDKPKTRGLLELAGLLEQFKIPGKINLETGVFSNQFTSQPLGFAIGPQGNVRTGTVGLNPATIAAQKSLSQRFGIPTFDIKGNISTFGGFVSSR